MQYRVDITDERSNITSSSPRTVTFEPLYFFGPVDTSTWVSKTLSGTNRADLITASEVDSNFVVKIESQTFTSGKLRFYTGTTPRVFVIAIPSSKSITQVWKYSTANTPPGQIPSSYYASPVTVNIASYDAGFSTEYKIYRLTFTSGFGTDGGDIYLEITL